MRKRKIIVVALLYFLLFNSASIWNKLPGLWDMAITAILILGFLVLVLVLLWQTVLVVKDVFRNRQRNINAAILASVLVLCAFFPFGIVPREAFEEPPILYAQYEGVANCTETLKLLENSRFKHTSICFGVDDYEGNYSITGDTIKLLYTGRSPLASKQAHGIIYADSSDSKYRGHILYYRNSNDDEPIPLRVEHNKLVMP